MSDEFCGAKVGSRDYLTCFDDGVEWTAYSSMRERSLLASDGEGVPHTLHLLTTSILVYIP